MTKTSNTARKIHSALAFLGYAHSEIKFMGAESISCCEITINGRKHRGATWVAALEAVACCCQECGAMTSHDIASGRPAPTMVASRTFCTPCARLAVYNASRQAR